MKNTRIARRYAMGLMAAVVEGKNLEPVARDLQLITLILRDSREFRMLLSTPVVSAEKKKKVFKELLGPHVCDATMKFVNLMTAKGREVFLGEVVEEFQALRDEQMGIITAEVKTAVELTPAQEQSLKEQLDRHTAKNVRLKVSLDKAIRGGLVLKIRDTVLDASIQHQLEVLRARLVEGGVISNT